MEKTEIYDLPISVHLDFKTGAYEPYRTFQERRLSDLAQMFYDQVTVKKLVATENPLIYDIRYHPFITSASDMALGVTRILPGKIGDEYHMTKGHFHESLDQPEIYFCVHGEGFLLMETAEGDFQVAPWSPGTITHIPPNYAHRVVNTGKDVLFFVASYHISAGHTYDLVTQRGFSQVVVEREGRPVFIDNPRR
jgi:glucose-6-phosphate isomerase